jgi:hypothetical protein
MKGKTKTRRIFQSFSALVIFLLAISSLSLAQGIAAGSGEVAGAFGYAHVSGVTSNNHFTFAGSGIYNANHFVAAGFEYKYTPLGSETIEGITGSGHLQTYGGVARFSFDESTGIVPYALVGFGGADLKAIVSAQNMNYSSSQGGFYFVFGGGATIFAGPHWGVRPEVRFERQHFDGSSANTSNGVPVAAFGQNDIQALASLFYQFGGSQKH